MSKNKSVLITGGSSGIGYELSKLFAKDGYNIFWISLYEKELRESKAALLLEYSNCQINYLAKDLSDLSAPKVVYDWAQSNSPIDILVNNAGIGTYGYIQDIDIDREIKMIKLNVLGLYQLTHYFLSTMLKRDAGKIMNISSSASFQPVPRMSTYASTKAFVKHFTESIQFELEYQRSNVQVTLVCPAAISDTNFKKEANMMNVNTFSGLVATSAQEVAQDAYKGLMNGKKKILSGKKLRVLDKVSMLIPNKILQLLLRKELDRDE